MFLKKLFENKQILEENPDIQKKLQYISEAYKSVRTNLMFTLAEKKEEQSKLVLVTSAMPGDGKTTTCLNLADAVAESGAKVLIVDADLRRPRLEHYITSEKKSKGLSDVLGGFESLENVIQKPEGCKFDCLFSGSIPPNPSELLMLASVEKLFAKLAEMYDYVFIDVPPVGIVSETIYLTQFVSGVVVVAKQQRTRRKALKDAIAALNFAKANILGFVLNGSDDASQHSYYRSRNKYYYYQ